MQSPTTKPPEAWTVAVSALSWSHPFWSTLLYEQLKTRFDNHPFPTLAVGGGNLYVCLSYFCADKFTPANRIFMIAHELCHEMLFHPSLTAEYAETGIDGEPFDRDRWAYAIDYIVNAFLIESGVGDYHSDWLHSEHFSFDDNVLDVYRRLKPKTPPPPQGSQSGQGGGSGSGSGDGEDEQPSQGRSGAPAGGPKSEPRNYVQYDILDKDGDVVSESPPLPKHEHQDDHGAFGDDSPHTPEDWKQAVAGAYQQAKSMGNGTVFMDRFVEDYLHTKRRWQDELRDYVVVSRGTDLLNRHRPHKRKMYERRLFVPTKHSYRMGDVAYVFDVSGSVSEQEMFIMRGVGVGIATDCKPKSLRVLCCATRVTDDKEYDEPEEFLQWQPSGGGGTDMEAAFQYLVDHDFLPEVCIVLTDGCTRFTEPPPFPVVWVSTYTPVEDFPYGHAIFMDENG